MTEPQSASPLMKAMALCVLAGPLLGVAFRDRIEPDGDRQLKIAIGLLVGLGGGFGACFALGLLAIILS